MRKLYAYLLVTAIAVSLFGCMPKPQPGPSEETGTTTAPRQTETPSTTEATSPAADKLMDQDTYWVASHVGVDETEALQPEVWALDLMIRTDGTARFRDIHNGVCLVDDSFLTLSWELTEDNALLFFSKLYPEPVMQGTYEGETLYLQYSETTFIMEETDIPQEVGECYTPSELAGTWLMVSGETEGYQWEAMPGELSSLIFRVTAYSGPLELRADMETLDYYGEMTDGVHGLEVNVLNEALYNECENSTWSVRIGPESPKDENGYPKEMEVYDTLLDYNTLLLQRYYTIDGAPAVSHQTYWRFPELVSWRTPEYIDLEYTNWVCTAYTNAQGEDRSPPVEMENFSLVMLPDQTCQLNYGDGTTLEGTWQIGNGGVMLLQGHEDTFWFGGAITAYCVETTYEVSDVFMLSLYYNGGILRLQMTGYG